MDANIQLMLYLVPTVIGLLLVLPLGRSIVTPFTERYTSLATERGRIFFGLILTCIAGAAVSFQTLWISSKISEAGGEFCSAGGVFSCDDVIGNPEYNVDPILGLPWGGIGAVTFCILLYFVYSSSKEPNADWVTMNLKMGAFVTFYWSGAMIGRFVGSYLTKIIRPSRVLSFFALGAVFMILISSQTFGIVSMISILAVGLFNSIMFPTIFSLSLEGLDDLKPQASGILCTMIVGGAIIPPLYGYMTDLFGFKMALLLLIGCYGYICLLYTSPSPRDRG